VADSRRWRSRRARAVTEVEYAVGETRSFVFAAGESMVHDLENAGDAELVFTTVEYLDSANPPLGLP
jgi:uncharacterized cupin superfamily protein